MVDRLEERLLFGVVDDLIGCTADRAVVGAQAIDRVAPNAACEKRLFELRQFLRDVVLAVELILCKDAQEDVLGQDVL